MEDNKVDSILRENGIKLTKNNIINLTVYLDSVEELYNKILEEYQSRNNGK